MFHKVTYIARKLRIMFSGCKKSFQFKTVCNGDMAYITEIKQQKSKGYFVLIYVEKQH